MASYCTLAHFPSRHVSPPPYTRCLLRAQPKVQTERAKMNPGVPDVILSKYLRDEAPLHVLAQFGNTFKRIDPSRFRLLQQSDQRVSKEGRLAPQANRVRQDPASGLAEQLLVGTPRQRGQTQQEI